MISWKSHTLKRRTVSTLSAETQGIVESAAVACWYRYLLAELFYSHLMSAGTVDWETMLEPLEFGAVTDAKSVYDALTTSTSTSSSTDKRAAIDLAIIPEYMRRHNGCVRWIDGTLQLADSLTKHMAADFLRSVLQRGTYHLNAEYDTLNLRQKARDEKKQKKSKSTIIVMECEFQGDDQRHAQIEKCTPRLDFLFHVRCIFRYRGVLNRVPAAGKGCRHGVGVLSPHLVTLVEFIVPLKNTVYHGLSSCSSLNCPSYTI